jgi:glycosyltransferase involved in cell wall biosynthesis
MMPGFETLGPLFLKRLYRKIIVISAIRGLWYWEMSFRYQRLKPMFISSFFKKVLKFIEYYSLKKVDIVIANGYDTAEKYRILIGRPIYVLPNGVDTTKFTPQPSTSIKLTKTIITVANLRALAGLNTLIKSVVYLKQIYPKLFKVKIVGGGDKRPFLKLAETLGVKQYIEFLGERQDISNLLREADVVACLKEGGGISHSLLEAMASGKAIVAWNTRVYNQVLTNGFNGLLVAKDDAKQLSEAFSKLLNDHEFAVVLGRNARAEAMKYDWNEIAKMLIKILSDKLQRK